MGLWGRIGSFVATFIFSYTFFTIPKTSADLLVPADHFSTPLISGTFLQQSHDLDQVLPRRLFTNSANLADNGRGFGHPKKYK
jgi:hypothetical protein